ncbi:M10 family metallopeptidase [Cochlodiniinecator piscidefendens]|uniref:M10 family metallopeptidase n=1 Tax=Cochlodiniinecator piscidefendens TaxID=2715756 RepID=UPI001E530C5F|nr:M10 family metallopeptidase [Cochlodiniinecator piscidefendens]
MCITCFMRDGDGTTFPATVDVGISDKAVISEGTDAPFTITPPTTPYTMSVGDTFSGSLSTYDTDLVAINLTAGEAVRLNMNGSGGSSGLDTILAIYDADGNRVGQNDDMSRTSRSSQLEITVETSGTYYVAAYSYNGASGSYNITATDMGTTLLPTYSHDQIASYLNGGYWEDSGRSARSFNIGSDGSISVDITSLTSAGRALATAALESWTNVTGIVFNFVDESVGAVAEIFFDDNNSGAYSVSNTLGSSITRSEVNVSTSWLTSSGSTLDSYSFSTYIHEIGHALGLGHAGSYNGNARYSVDTLNTDGNHYLNDSWQATVMSYMSPDDNTFITSSYAQVVTPMIADILAVQSLYDLTNTGQRTGNTTYGENSNAGGYLDGLSGLTNPIMFTIYDDGGTDTLDLRSSTSAQRIDMRSETVSDIYGQIGTLSIARGTVIENVISGRYADTITGNDTDNVITGGGGADTIDGGDGSDTAVFGANRSAATITTTGDTTRVTISGVTSTLTNVEQLRFNDQTVALTSSNTAPVATLENLELAPGAWSQIGLAVAYSDADNDAATQYQVSGTGTFWLTGSGVIDASSGYTLTAEQLSGLWVQGAANTGAQTLRIRANDGTEWGAWDNFTLTTSAPNTRPVTTVDDISVVANTRTSLASLVNYSDADSDAVTQYEVWDASGENSFWLQGTGLVDATSGYTLTSAQLASLSVQGDSSAGSQTLWIRASDGEDWSAWDSFTLTTTADPSAGNVAPVATIEDLSLDPNAWNLIGNAVTYSDANNDAATQYEIWDNQGTNSFWVQGVGTVNAASGYEITADQLAGLWVQGAASGGTQTLWIRANDGTEWGAWDSFDLTTTGASNATPTVAVADLALDTGQTTNISANVNYSDGDSDAATQYEIWDDVGGNSFLLNGSAIDASAGYTLSASELSGLGLQSDATNGTQTLWIRVNDGTEWSAWDSFDFTTGPSNAAPTATLENLTLGANETVNIGRDVVYTDGDNDAATQYQVWDDAGSDSFLLNGSAIDADTGYTLSASELDNLQLNSGSSDGTQTLWVRAHDGTTWGAWDSFVLTTASGHEAQDDAFIF